MGLIPMLNSLLAEGDVMPELRHLRPRARRRPDRDRCRQGHRHDRRQGRRVHRSSARSPPRHLHLDDHHRRADRGLHLLRARRDHHRQDGSQAGRGEARTGSTPHAGSERRSPTLGRRRHPGARPPFDESQPVHEEAWTMRMQHLDLDASSALLLVATATPAWAARKAGGAISMRHLDGGARRRASSPSSCSCSCSASSPGSRS